jgi:hypothetical protein
MNPMDGQDRIVVDLADRREATLPDRLAWPVAAVIIAAVSVVLWLLVAAGIRILAG